MKQEGEKNYAKGILDLSWERGESEKVGEELALLGEALLPITDLDNMLRSGALRTEDLMQAIDHVSDKMGALKLTRSFLELLIKRKRLRLLPKIAREYRKLLEQRSNMTTAEIISVVPLSESHKSRLKSSLKARTGLDIKLKERIDPNVQGGLVIRVFDVIYDGSLRTRIERVRKDLARG